MSSEQPQRLNRFLRTYKPLASHRQVMGLTIVVALSLLHTPTLPTTHTSPVVAYSI